MKVLFVTLALVVTTIGAVFFTANGQSSAMPPGFHDDLSGYIQYTSGWTYFSSDDEFEGGAMWTQTYNDSMSFTFYGDAIWFFYRGDTGQGNVTICIDGGCLLHSLATGSIVYRASISYSGLTLDEHTVTITKSDNNTNWVNLDGVRVSGSSPVSDVIVNITIPPVEVTVEVAVPTPEWRSQWEVEDGDGGQQMVAFDYQVSAGEVAIALLLSALTLILGIHVFTNQWRKRK